MVLVFTLTLPGLCVLLTIAAAVDVALGHRRSQGTAASGQTPVATAGFDMLGITLAPSVKHRLQYESSRRMRRDEAGDADPRFSRVDLDEGVAHIVLPADGPVTG